MWYTGKYPKWRVFFLEKMMIISEWVAVAYFEPSTWQFAPGRPQNRHGDNDCKQDLRSFFAGCIALVPTIDHIGSFHAQCLSHANTV